MSFKRTTENGIDWIELCDGYRIAERQVCQHCADETTGHARAADARYSFGCYAGKYCDDCWPKSGFRDAVDPDAVFDPLDAGEMLIDTDDPESVNDAVDFLIGLDSDYLD